MTAQGLVEWDAALMCIPTPDLLAASATLETLAVRPGYLLDTIMAELEGRAEFEYPNTVTTEAN